MADVRIRPARREDLPRIVELLADDDLGRGREHPGEDLSPYARAFMDIDEDPRNELIVVEAEGEVIATLQLTFIPSLTHTGGERAQVSRGCASPPARAARAWAANSSNGPYPAHRDAAAKRSSSPRTNAAPMPVASTKRWASGQPTKA